MIKDDTPDYILLCPQFVLNRDYYRIYTVKRIVIFIYVFRRIERFDYYKFLGIKLVRFTLAGQNVHYDRFVKTELVI